MHFISKNRFSTSLPSFLNYRLHPSLIQALQANAFHTPTPIQDMTLSAMHNHNNLLLIAPTGTGKTLAYALPMLHLLKTQEDDF